MGYYISIQFGGWEEEQYSSMLIRQVNATSGSGVEHVTAK
jgi:hypothetical protein